MIDVIWDMETSDPDDFLTLPPVGAYVLRPSYPTVSPLTVSVCISI